MPPGKTSSVQTSRKVSSPSSSPDVWASERSVSRPTPPRVSVVVPAYNAEGTLAECLVRVFGSTYEGLEVVLIDDGSTDHTRAIAARFPVRLESTGGRVGPAARNLGARWRRATSCCSSTPT